jgi:hypothetical protein
MGIITAGMVAPGAPAGVADTPLSILCDSNGATGVSFRAAL